MDKKKRLKVIVSGKVQGIGYRWFVRDEAKKNRLCGWVKNLSNGSVEIEAEGSEDILKDFLNAITKHPYAIISSVKDDWSEPSGNEEKSFSIVF